MVEAGSTMSTQRLCGFSSFGKFSLGSASAPPRPNFPVEDKSHNLRVDIVDPILLPQCVGVPLMYRGGYIA